MKVWITKYALTQGIYEVEAEIKDHTMAYVDSDCGGQYFHGEGRQWHLRKESAVKKANEIRDSAIASTLKRLEKLKKLRFDLG